MTLSILPVGTTDLAHQPDVVCLLSFQMGNESVGASPGKAPFTELFGLSPSFNVCSEGIDLCLGCNNIIFKLSVVADFGEVSPVIQLPHHFSEGVVVNDSLLLVVGPGFTRRVQKTTDHREEFKDTKGQYYDQDLKHYDKELEQINYDELHSSWGRARGEVAMDSLRDCLSYCSSIYTFYKYVLVWHNQQ